MKIQSIDLKTINCALGFQEKYKGNLVDNHKPLKDYRMEVEDRPIIRYLIRGANPRRHLEIGTYSGSGVVACLDESLATVWTINIPSGEFSSSGESAYGSNPYKVNIAYNNVNATFLFRWLSRIWPSFSRALFNRLIGNKIVIEYPPDALGRIGVKYISKALGHRVCQIYCDSKNWDTSNYPLGFFDTCLIDGGHDIETVISDTRKSLPLIRSKGIIMWHDYCPDSEVIRSCSSVKGVVAAIDVLGPELERECEKIFWINPSWLLIGVKK